MSLQTSLWLFVSLSVAAAVKQDVASFPLRGWNSYDSYDWWINETQLFAEANAMVSRLLPSGYSTLMLDWYWYRDGRGNSIGETGFPVNLSCQLNFDGYGRMFPDPIRFPSTKETKSWTPITSRLKEMGLSFGVHLMPGVTTFCDEDWGNCEVPNTPGVRIPDIIDRTRKSPPGGKICPNCTFYMLNMSMRGSQEWYDAYFAQLAEWGITFVKVDFLNPKDPYLDNVQAMARAIEKTGAPIMFLAHGVSTVEQAKAMGPYVNLYRITGDVHDNWGAIKSGFRKSEEYAGHNLEGAPGLQGRSWPDHECLALGKQLNARPNKLSEDEQYTMMTLWGITRSPLIFGGRVSNMSKFIEGFLTNEDILAVSESGIKPHTFSPVKDHPVWVTGMPGGSAYVAVFNMANDTAEVTLHLRDVVSTIANPAVRDVWAQRELPVRSRSVTVNVRTHGVSFLHVTESSGLNDFVI